MAYSLTYTPCFNKHFRNLSDEEKKQLKSKLELLVVNPLHPSLRTKRIKGTDGLFECSVNIDASMIEYYKDQSKESGIPNQTLINMYLSDCAVNKRKLQLSWK